MLNTILTKIIGTRNERELKGIRPLVYRIGELEAPLLSVTDAALQAKTAEFRQRLANGEGVDSLLP